MSSQKFLDNPHRSPSARPPSRLHQERHLEDPFASRIVLADQFLLFCICGRERGGGRSANNITAASGTSGTSVT
jgi:hypothetical protein